MTKHNTQSHIPAHERSPLQELPLFPTTKTDVPPVDRTISEEIAVLDIEQLRRSERGQLALVALRDLLRRDSTWSLDAFNQGALTRLLEAALVTPQIRELVIDSVTAARIH